MDTALLRSLKNELPNTPEFTHHLKAVNLMISNYRLMFLKKRGTYTAHYCNFMANGLQKEVDIILKMKGIK